MLERSFVDSGYDRFGNELRAGSEVTTTTGRKGRLSYLYTNSGAPSTPLLARVVDGGNQPIGDFAASDLWVGSGFDVAAAEGDGVAWMPLFEVPDGYEIIVPRALGGDDTTWRTIAGSRYGPEYTEYFLEGVSEGLAVENDKQHDCTCSPATRSAAELQRQVDSAMPTAHEARGGGHG